MEVQTMGTSIGVSAKLLLVSFVYLAKNLRVAMVGGLCHEHGVLLFHFLCQVGNGYVNVLNSSERMFKFCARSGYIRSVFIYGPLKMCSQILGAPCI